MPRRLDDWLTNYLKYVDHTEPPLQFHVWCAVSAIAGALQRRVFIDFEGIHFPNHYVILVGPSGTTRKGGAIRRASYFLKELEPYQVKLIKGNRVTKERLVMDLAACTVQYSDMEGNQLQQNAATHIVPELATFIGHQDIALLAWLTDWWESDEHWEDRTKTAGIAVVDHMCYNLLGAAAPDWFESMLPKEAIGGGFTSRCIFVYGHRKRKVVIPRKPTASEETLRTYLLEDIFDMMNLVGEFTITPSALNVYTCLLYTSPSPRDS